MAIIRRSGSYINFDFLTNFINAFKAKDRIYNFAFTIDQMAEYINIFRMFFIDIRCTHAISDEVDNALTMMIDFTDYLPPRVFKIVSNGLEISKLQVFVALSDSKIRTNPKFVKYVVKIPISSGRGCLADVVSDTQYTGFGQISVEDAEYISERIKSIAAESINIDFIELHKELNVRIKEIHFNMT